MGSSGPPSNTLFPGPPESATQMASRSVQPFLQGFGQSVPKTPYTLKWATLPLKIAPSRGGCGPPSNACFLGPTRVLNPNGILIGSAIFARFTTVTDRPSHKPCYSVCNNRPHLPTYVILQCGLINNKSFVRSFVLFGQESSLLWTPARRPSAGPVHLPLGERRGIG